MNEFISKKIGEVLAFSEIGIETIEKTRDTLKPEVEETFVLDILEKNQLHAEELRKIASENNIIETVEAKQGETGGKLRQMRDMYIDEKWNSPSHIFEWMLFFEGAAYGHWALIKGAGESANREDLILLAEEAMNFHHETLEKVVSELEQVGMDKGDEN
ncbi:hypothetical protein KC842_01560 [Candidatus Nomurabacteria bacterium]|nr:hypothetical protein [Candidatus Nomurabacteria bacterium]USN94518.1 MAG: hypothetical protein H6791_02015 [Candidatus Nomurabacteria bacterium]